MPTFNVGCPIRVTLEAIRQIWLLTNLFIGSGFVNTAEMTLVCMRKIYIGYHVTTSWNTLLMDTDFHATIDTITGKTNPYTSSIEIGDNVWVCTRAVVLKGSKIPNGCIVGANAVVTSKYSSEHALIAGNPAVIKKTHITMQCERQ